MVHLKTQGVYLKRSLHNQLIKNQCCCYWYCGRERPYILRTARVILKLSLEKLWDTLEVKVANETLMLLKGIYILRDFWHLLSCLRFLECLLHCCSGFSIELTWTFTHMHDTSINLLTVVKSTEHCSILHIRSCPHKLLLCIQLILGCLCTINIVMVIGDAKHPQYKSVQIWSIRSQVFCTQTSTSTLLSMTFMLYKNISPPELEKTFPVNIV